MNRICCLCGKIEFKGQWQKISSDSSQKGISHAYCPLCYEILMDEIERFAMQRLSKPVYSVVNIGQLQAA